MARPRKNVKQNNPPSPPLHSGKPIPDSMVKIPREEPVLNVPAPTQIPQVEPELLFIRGDGQPVYRVKLPPAKMGSKVFLIEKKGVYVLEDGPAILRSLACTYVGTGSLVVRDGTPSDNGYFDVDKCDPYSPEYALTNGRKVYAAAPVCIGFWGLDCALVHGLTVEAAGGTKDGSVLVTVCWMEQKIQPKAVTLMVDD